MARPVPIDQGFFTASQGSCHVHGSSGVNPPTSPYPNSSLTGLATRDLTNSCPNLVRKPRPAFCRLQYPCVESL